MKLKLEMSYMEELNTKIALAILGLIAICIIIGLIAGWKAGILVAIFISIRLLLGIED